LAAGALLLIVSLTLVAACERGANGDRAAVQSASEDREPLPPPIDAPTESASPDEPPSYEVAIATAAAERNRMKRRCTELPEVERAACEADADAAFAAASADLESLRGNQP
jgi:hypothetical protein